MYRFAWLGWTCSLTYVLCVGLGKDEDASVPARSCVPKLRDAWARVDAVQQTFTSIEVRSLVDAFGGFSKELDKLHYQLAKGRCALEDLVRAITDAVFAHHTVICGARKSLGCRR